MQRSVWTPSTHDYTPGCWTHFFIRSDLLSLGVIWAVFYLDYFVIWTIMLSMKRGYKGNLVVGLSIFKSALSEFELCVDLTIGLCLSIAMLSALDDSVGNITKALFNRGMLNNTIIVFSTDNGGPANGFDMNDANNWPLRYNWILYSTSC